MISGVGFEDFFCQKSSLLRSCSPYSTSAKVGRGFPAWAVRLIEVSRHATAVRVKRKQTCDDAFMSDIVPVAGPECKNGDMPKGVCD